MALLPWPHDLAPPVTARPGRTSQRALSPAGPSTGHRPAGSIAGGVGGLSLTLPSALSLVLSPFSTVFGAFVESVEESSFTRSAVWRRSCGSEGLC